MVKARPSSYCVDVASTGRAKCRGKCKAKIPRGDLRLVELVRYKPGRCMKRFFCIPCVTNTPRLMELVRENAIVL
jgi:hypothetical protein